MGLVHGFQLPSHQEALSSFLCFSLFFCPFVHVLEVQGEPQIVPVTTIYIRLPLSAPAVMFVEHNSPVSLLSQIAELAFGLLIQSSRGFGLQSHLRLVAW